MSDHSQCRDVIRTGLAEQGVDAGEWEIRPCAAPSPDPVAHGLPLQCEGQAGHGGDHYALRGSVTWPAGGESP